MSTRDLFDDLVPSPSLCLPDEVGYSAEQVGVGEGVRATVPGGGLLLVPGFVDPASCKKMLAFFQENRTVNWEVANWRDAALSNPEALEFLHVRWKQDTIRLYGKRIPLPRLTSWYGDDGKVYTYSGITSAPNPWNDTLLRLKARVESASGATFNSLLLNWYRDGEDQLGWHADDERELGRNPIIASVNFGETRDFILRRNDDHTKRIVIPLENGTLLVMSGALQQHWQHSVPKRAKVKGSRFNLTFRSIQLTA